MNKYFKSKNQPVLDKYGRILVNEAKVKRGNSTTDHSYMFPKDEETVNGNCREFDHIWNVEDIDCEIIEPKQIENEQP